jgi:uncharacterized membrane protein
MRCGNCGVEMIAGAAFCASCGRPVISADASTGAVVTSSGLQANVAGALCYLAGFVTGIVFLVLEPYRHDRFVRFHAFQAIFLSVAWVILHFALGISMSLMPWTLWHFTAALSSLVSLAFLGLAFLLMYKAYSNERFKLPVIGDLAEKHD